MPSFLPRFCALTVAFGLLSAAASLGHAASRGGPTELTAREDVQHIANGRPAGRSYYADARRNFWQGLFLAFVE